MSEHTGKPVPRKGPYVMTVKPGTYWWCACGRSQAQPFCDGTHKQAGGGPPLKVEISEEQEVSWCGCKQSAARPFCDGTHKKL